MESKPTLTLPLIDFSKQEIEWELVKGQARQALEEYGAFEAFFDKTPGLELQKAMFQAFEETFNLPLETKQMNVYKKNTLGHTASSPLLPFYESLAIGEANNSEKVDSGFTNIMWRDGKPKLSKTIHSFAEHLAKFDEIVRRMILESFGLEKYMEEHLGSTTYTLRGSKYRTSPESPELKLALPSHKDKNIITILCQLNQVDGLEVQTKDGDWINAKFSSPDSYVVLVGECLHGWLNGRLPVPYHRVMLSGDKERYSIGGFSSKKNGYMIKVPEEMVDDEHPLLYKPFEISKYMEYLRPEPGNFRPVSLKDYCGV